MSRYKGKYANELIKNAAYIGTSGKCILAADESTGTAGKRLASINVENVESNRWTLRELIVCFPDALQYLSGVIVFEDTLYQKTVYGKPFVDVLKEGGVLPGIQVDKGTIELVGTNGETTTQGLDGLARRCQKYYEAGARFAKWCAVLKIGPTEPSQVAIDENADGLALYAFVCQQKGLVPIIELQILADGSHDIDKCAEVTKPILTACYKALTDYPVLLEGTILKTNFVTPGSKAPFVAAEEIAEHTIRVLQDIVPEEVPTVLFSSGVASDVKVFKQMKKLRTKMSWTVVCSLRLALQAHMLKVLTAEDIVKKAHAAFVAKCNPSSKSTIGIYKGEDTQLSEGNSVLGWSSLLRTCGSPEHCHSMY